MPCWLPIVARHRDTPFTEEQRNWQLLRRGRYLGAWVGCRMTRVVVGMAQGVCLRGYTRAAVQRQGALGASDRELQYRYNGCHSYREGCLGIRRMGTL